jgi:hypothetical protein
MTKDEALDLALEELENCADLLKVFDAPIDSCVGASMLQAEKAITAIKQVRALDKKAENARELGLDYEPADGTQVSKVWWDGEKLMAKPIPLEDIYQPVQEPVGLIDRLTNPEQHYEFTDPKKANAVLMSLCQEAADALAAPTVQEPLGFISQKQAHRIKDPEDDSGAYIPMRKTSAGNFDLPVYTTPPAAQPAHVQEPVACEEQHPNNRLLFKRLCAAAGIELGKDNIASALDKVIAIKQALAQPAPVPLTDEQIESLLPDDDTPMSLGEAFVRFARLVEAHHGITKGQP